jgi:hypothetical protein
VDSVAVISPVAAKPAPQAGSLEPFLRPFKTIQPQVLDEPLLKPAWASYNTSHAEIYAPRRSPGCSHFRRLL